MLWVARHLDQGRDLLAGESLRCARDLELRFGVLECEASCRVLPTPEPQLKGPRWSAQVHFSEQLPSFSRLQRKRQHLWDVPIVVYGAANQLIAHVIELPVKGQGVDVILHENKDQLEPGQINAS